jgi:PAS domain S-box-containing protein
MSNKPTTDETTVALRRSAERRATDQPAPAGRPRTQADVRRLLHELEVHQIELEMQNAELQIARDEASALLDQYTGLYDFAPVGYFTLAADGTIRLANLTATRLLGIARSRLVGRVFGLLVPTVLRPAFQAYLSEVFAGETGQSLETELLCQGQSSRCVNIEALRLPGGEEVSVVVVDITERKRAENDLRVSETRYRRLFETAHDGILVLDPDTCKITDANPFMTQLLGYPRDELIGKELFEIGLLKDGTASKKMFKNLKRNREVRYEDLPLECQGGRHQEVEVVANLYQENDRSVIQCNIRDITERKRNETLFAALIEQAPVGIYVVDANFRLQQVNPGAMPVFKHVEPLIGRDFSEIHRLLCEKRVSDQVVRRFRHTLATGEPYLAPEFVQRRLDTGEEEIYEWQIQRITLPAGEFGVVAFINNITERKHAEATQRHLAVLTASNLKLQAEIVRRQAVESALQHSEQQQGQLLKQAQLQQQQLRHLSHEMLHAQEQERKRISRELHDVIAQALVGINVHVAALSQAIAGNPVTLQRKIARMHQVVENALDIVHRFARQLRPTMLDDLGLIPALETFMKSFMEDTGVRVRLKSVTALEQASDAVRTVLYRVAQEALTNVARHAKASCVEVSIQTDAGNIRMEIQDDGQGFEVDEKSDSAKCKRLGLIGMRERVEMIGGTFCVDSAPGRPTTVRVEIPSENDCPAQAP